MKEYYLTFRSMTAAMSAAKKLEAVGLHLRPTATPEALRQRGCGYCLRLKEEQFFLSSDGLQRMKYERIYIHQGERWREIAL